MKKISINNGISFCEVDDALQNIKWDVIVHFMDDDIREDVHSRLAPCSKKDFLIKYLKIARADLIIG